MKRGTGNIIVAEDGGDMEAVMIRRDDFAPRPGAVAGAAGLLALRRRLERRLPDDLPTT